MACPCSEMDAHPVRIPAAHPVRIARLTGMDIGDGGERVSLYACVCEGSHPYGTRPHTPDEVRHLIEARQAKVGAGSSHK